MTEECYPHECVPTQDAYDAAVRALEKHRKRADDAEAMVAELRAELSAIHDIAYRSGGGDAPRDALEAIQARAGRAATMEV